MSGEKKWSQRRVVVLLPSSLSLTKRGKSELQREGLIIKECQEWILWRIWVRMDESLMGFYMGERDLRRREGWERKVQNSSPIFFFWCRPRHAEVQGAAFEHDPVPVLDPSSPCLGSTLEHKQLRLSVAPRFLNLISLSLLISNVP